MSSATLASVEIPTGAVWTELIAPVLADSVAVWQQFRTDREYDFVTSTTQPTGEVAAYTMRPEMARDYISWNLSSGHGVWVRHFSSDSIFITVGVEDA